MPNGVLERLGLPVAAGESWLTRTEKGTSVSDCTNAAEALIDRLDRLHSAPQIAQQVVRLTKDPNFDVQDIVACIQRDPALTARVLSVVNSSRYALQNKATNVKQAVNYLGPRTIRLITLTFGLVDSLSNGVSASVYQTYWRRALTMASLSCRLAEQRDDVDVDDAYTAGLLADVGVLVLAQFHTDQCAALTESFTHGPELIAAELFEFGVGHSMLGARLFERWGAADDLVEAIEGHHFDDPVSESPLALTVRTASLLADAILTPQSESVVTAKNLLNEEFGLDTDALIDLVLDAEETINREAEEFSLGIGNPIDSQNLIAQAQRLFTDAAFDSALDIDTLTAAVDDFATDPPAPW